MLTLEIDIDRIFENIAVIKRVTGAKIYAVVKANAYGHGAELCRYIAPKVHGFAVSCLREAAQLIEAGISSPILVLCPDVAADSCEPLSGNITRTVCDFADIKWLKGNVAIKINTGMNRLGFAPKDVKKAVNAVNSNKDLTLKEVFTHFYSLNGAEEQLKLFNAAVEGVSPDVLRHCSASSCLTLEKRFHLDAVRCGLAVYGYGDNSALKPAMSAYTQIEQINLVKKGAHIGYGDYTAQKDTVVAVLKAGYADGIRRISGQKVAIGGKICDIIGNVCMDMCMADIGGINAQRGDKAYFICDALNAEMIAKNQNTVPYEILTGFSSKRINRVYIENGLYCKGIT